MYTAAVSYRTIVPLALVVATLPACRGPKPATSPVAPAATPADEPPAPTVEAVAALELPEGNYVINLYDAFGVAQPGLTQDFGFSALVRYEGKTILFDAGTNADILARNCKALGIDLGEVDIAVASHSHFDHIGGFDYLLEVNPDVKIYFPNDPFWGAPLPFDATGQEPEAAADLPEEQRYFGGAETKFTFRQSGRFWKADVEYVDASREIIPGVHLITTSSPFMGYFSSYPNMDIAGGASSEEIKKLELPELSLSLETSDGEVLLVGCSHSLVVRIVEETRAVLGRDLALVLGGYHLLPYGSEEVSKMALRMRDELGVAAVAPAHCTGHVGFKVFRELFGDDYHLAGLGSVIPFAGA